MSHNLYAHSIVRILILWGFTHQNSRSWALGSIQLLDTNQNKVTQSTKHGQFNALRHLFLSLLSSLSLSIPSDSFFFKSLRIAEGTDLQTPGCKLTSPSKARSRRTPHSMCPGQESANGPAANGAASEDAPQTAINGTNGVKKGMLSPLRLMGPALARSLNTESASTQSVLNGERVTSLVSCLLILASLPRRPRRLCGRNAELIVHRRWTWLHRDPVTV